MVRRSEESLEEDEWNRVGGWDRRVRAEVIFTANLAARLL
jgi:hypothetical protein